MAQVALAAVLHRGEDSPRRSPPGAP